MGLHRVADHPRLFCLQMRMKPETCLFRVLRGGGAQAIRLVQVSSVIALLTSAYSGHVKHAFTSRALGDCNQAICGNVRALCHARACILGVGATHNRNFFLVLVTCSCMQYFIAHSLATSLHHIACAQARDHPHMRRGTCPHNTVRYGR